jgi:hypothetical protein
MNEIAEKITKDLPELLGAIAEKEKQVFQLYQALVIEKAIVQAQEDAALLQGLIDGRNADLREAQLRAIGTPARERLREAEKNYGWQKLELALLHLEFKSIRTLAMVLGGISE